MNYLKYQNNFIFSHDTTRLYTIERVGMGMWGVGVVDDEEPNSSTTLVYEIDILIYCLQRESVSWDIPSAS